MLYQCRKKGLIFIITVMSKAHSCPRVVAGLDSLVYQQHRQDVEVGRAGVSCPGRGWVIAWHTHQPTHGHQWEAGAPWALEEQ